MTRLVRFVSEAQDCRKAFVGRDRGSKILPLAIARAFTPTIRENAKLSLYRLTDDAEIPRLAAAWWLIQKDQFAMIALDEEKLKKAGATLHYSEPGNTYNSEVNNLHVDLDVISGEQINLFARLFFEEGELLPVESAEIRDSIANDNSQGLIDFPKLGKEKNQASLGRLGELIHNNTLVLR